MSHWFLTLLVCAFLLRRLASGGRRGRKGYVPAGQRPE
jgi:hypothetical protein